MVATPLLVAAGIGAAGSVASGVISSSASKSAAKTQAQAADQAAQNQMAMFQQTQANLSPFMQFGQSEIPALTNALPSLTQPFQMTPEQLSQMPGYQFQLQQGELAAQSGFAAQGLGTSGAAMKGGINYAEGLAGTSFQQQFQNYLQQNQNIYGMLAGPIGIGENAAALTGNLGQQAVSGANNYLTGGAAATAAGTIGSANALGGTLNSLSGLPMNLAFLNAIGGGNNSSLFGGGGGGGMFGNLGNTNNDASFVPDVFAAGNY